MNKNLDRLLDCENELASATPFGDWKTIINRNLTFYDQVVNLLAKQFPTVGELQTKLRGASVEQRFRLFGDPSVRTAVTELLERVKAGEIMEMPDESQKVFDHAARWLGSGENRLPLEVGGVMRRVEISPQRATVWSVKREDDVFGSRFQRLFDREIAPSISSRPAVLRDPTDVMLQTLVKGAELLDELLPQVGRSVMAHVHLIGIVDVSDQSKWDRKIRADLCQSVSTHAVPGTIFLSPSVLRTPYHAAEALFHEAGHKKLSDLVFTRSIFREGYTDKDSPTIPALWNRSVVWNSAEWSIDRALFAAHVYVHLGLFFAMLTERASELQSRFGAIDGMNPCVSMRGGYNRARYLLREIAKLADKTLGPDGVSCLNWLQKILDKLDPTPPVNDPDIHLLLDRYDRETREVAALLGMIKADETSENADVMGAEYAKWSGPRLADHFVQSEIVSGYRLLSIIGEREQPAFAFYDGDRWSIEAKSNATPMETAAAFTGIRTFVSRTLRHLPESAYGRSCQTRRNKTLKEMVAETVEHAGRHVDLLLDHIRQQRRNDKAGAKSQPLAKTAATLNQMS